MSRNSGAILLASLMGINAIAFAHSDGAYYHDTSDLPELASWMSGIDDDVELRAISLPGTHDSASCRDRLVDRTQSLTIDQQLRAGIRYLDVALRHEDDVLSLECGAACRLQVFGDVLGQVHAFLRQHPSETVLMRVREELSGKRNSRSFAATFADYYRRYADIAWTASSERPKLREVRGRLVFVVDFLAARGGRLGLSYSSFNSQEDNTISNEWDLYSKWEKVKAQLMSADSAPRGHAGFINYLAAGGGAFPYFAASGHVGRGTGADRMLTGLIIPRWIDAYADLPRTDCFMGVCSVAFEGINTLTKDYINRAGSGFYGIIVADFPGADLIAAIVQSNFPELTKGIQLFRGSSSTAPRARRSIR